MIYNKPLLAVWIGKWIVGRNIVNLDELIGIPIIMHSNFRKNRNANIWKFKCFENFPNLKFRLKPIEQTWQFLNSRT